MTLTSEPPPSPTARYVLIVEDDASLRRLAVQVLRVKGIPCGEAVDGHDALEQAALRRPDLVLMDLTMPGLDGWETTRRLRQLPRGDKLPIVALTGHRLEGAFARAAAVLYDAVVHKPYLPYELTQVVERLLGTGRTCRAAASPDPGTVPGSGAGVETFRR